MAAGVDDLGDSDPGSVRLTIPAAEVQPGDRVTRTQVGLPDGREGIEVERRLPVQLPRSRFAVVKVTWKEYGHGYYCLGSNGRWSPVYDGHMDLDPDDIELFTVLATPTEASARMAP